MFVWVSNRFMRWQNSRSPLMLTYFEEYRARHTVCIVIPWRRKCHTLKKWSWFSSKPPYSTSNHIVERSSLRWAHNDQIPPFSDGSPWHKGVEFSEFKPIMLQRTSFRSHDWAENLAFHWGEAHLPSSFLKMYDHGMPLRYRDPLVAEEGVLFLLLGVFVVSVGYTTVRWGTWLEEGFFYLCPYLNSEMMVCPAPLFCSPPNQNIYSVLYRTKGTTTYCSTQRHFAFLYWTRSCRERMHGFINTPVYERFILISRL